MCYTNKLALPCLPYTRVWRQRRGWRITQVLFYTCSRLHHRLPPANVKFIVIFLIHASDTGQAEGFPIAPSRGPSVEFPFKWKHYYLWNIFFQYFNLLQQTSFHHQRVVSGHFFLKQCLQKPVKTLRWLETSNATGFWNCKLNSSIVVERGYLPVMTSKWVM